MEDEHFQKYSDAVAYARQVASSLTLSVMVKRSTSGWMVSVSDSSRLSASTKSSVTTSRKLDRPITSKSRSQWQRSGRTTSPKKQGAVKERSARLYAPRPKVLKPAPKNNKRAPRLKIAAQMGIPRDQLIALKVFYLGRGIAKSPTKSSAVDLIQQELESLPIASATRERFIFFNLLLAETFRGETEGALYREVAFKSAAEDDSAIFDTYMKIVEETQKPTSVDVLTGRNINTGQIESHSTIFTRDSFGVFHSWVVDNALVALQLTSGDLTPDQSEFVHRTTLIDIINSHELGPVASKKS